MIHAEQMSKTYAGHRGATPALDRVDIEVTEGALVSIVGPSGCGKSTLLRIVAGLETPTSGMIRVAGRVPGIGRIGFVFQEPVLLPWLSTLRNIRLPLDTAGVAAAEAEATARRMIELVGLAGFEHALPRELSGGMRQRVSIARALSYDPPILLLDEPFGALDLLTRDRMNDELLAIWQATRKTIVLVTHSVEEAAYLSDEVMVMSARPGRIKARYAAGLPRPRGEATRLDPAFHALMADLRRDLR